MKISIRKATSKDLQAVYDLVVELAIYEKEPKSVIASLDDYQKAFSEGIFEGIVAESQGQILGMALYYMTFSTWRGKMLYLEDFVVKEAFRGQGIGNLLFEAYQQEAYDQGATMLKWQVLDWNKPAIHFYEQRNAIIEKQWYNGKIYLNNV